MVLYINMSITEEEINEYIINTQDKFNDLENLESEINLIENTIENQKSNNVNLSDLKDQYERENNEYANNKSNIEKRLHTNDRKIYYENNETRKLIFYNVIFSYIFWFFLVILGLVLLYKNKILDIFFIIRIIILFLFYYFGKNVILLIIFLIQSFLRYFNFVYYTM